MTFEPAPSGRRSRSPRHRHIWTFEWMEERVLLSSSPGDPYVDDGQLSDAYVIALNPDGSASQSAFLATATESDAFQFRANVSGLVTIVATAGAGLSSGLSLYAEDASGRYINSANSDGSLSFHVDSGDLDYLILSNTDGLSTGSYSLAISINPMPDAASAIPLTVPVPVASTDHALAYDGDENLFQFVAPASGILTVAVASLATSVLEPLLSFDDASGAPIVQAAGPRSTTAQGRLSVVAGQSYLIRVDSASSASLKDRVGAYSIALSLAGREFGPDGTLASAEPVAPSMTIVGSIGPAESHDFRVQPTVNSRVTASVAAVGLRTHLSLLDNQGQVIAQSDGTSTTDPDDLIAQYLPAGTYYLQVQALDGGSGTFTLTTQSVAGSFEGSFPTSRGSSATTTTTNAPLAVGDFNGDQIPDVATADGIEFGLGDGGYGQPVPYPFNSSATVTAAAAGHFTASGGLDLAVAVLLDGTDYLVILGNQGDGSLAFDSYQVLSGDVLEMAAGHFHGPGATDLAMVMTGSDDVTIEPGNGDGTFGSPDDVPVGSSPGALVVADFNHDGKDDIATANTGSDDVSVLIGLGDGSFLPQVREPVGRRPTSIASADFLVNQAPDLITANSGSSDISVLSNLGDGTFAPPVEYPVGEQPSTVVVGHFYGVGNELDVATANGSSTDDLGDSISPYGGGISILRGLGNGTFSAPHAVDNFPNSLGYGPSGLVVADFNGDGRDDLLASRQSTTTILFGLGDGDFQGRTTGAASTGNSPYDIVSGDFNADVIPDLVVANGDSGDISVLLGEGHGQFRSVQRLYSGNIPFAVATGDFNRDDRLDIAVANFASNTVSVFLNRGDGFFEAPITLQAGDGPRGIVVADLNGDGIPDIAVPNSGDGTISLFLGRGDGSFDPQVVLRAGEVPNWVVAADLNGDGITDLAVPDLYAPYGISILYGLGGGAFEPPTFIPLPNAPIYLVAADFSDDGIPDLAVNLSDGLTAGPTVLVLMGLGHGSFSDPIGYGDIQSPEKLIAADFNGDKRPDLALSIRSTGDILILNNAGDGTFPTSTTITLDPSIYPGPVTSGQFTGDGRIDLAGGSRGENSVLIEVNQGDGTFASQVELALSLFDIPLVDDLDGDYVPDLIEVDSTGRILLRRGIIGQSTAYQPPVVLNPSNPALDIAFIQGPIGPAPVGHSGNLIAAVDTLDNAVSLYSYGEGGASLMGKLATGSVPAQIIAADLNGDGLTDLVIRNAGDDTLSIYLGLPGGGFSRRPDLAVGPGASDVEAIQESGEGAFALAVTDQAIGDVRIFTNVGDGHFLLEATDRAGVGPYGVVGLGQTTTPNSLEATAGVASGTFAPGGRTFLATINPGSNTLAILDGIGDGTFANPRKIPTTTPATLIRVADLTGDGIDDLIVLGSDGVTVFLGDGRGGFTREDPIGVGPDPEGLTIADVDHNGIPDLLVGNGFGDVLILLGNGDGTFRPFENTQQKVSLAIINPGMKDSFVFASQASDQVSVQAGVSGPMPISGYKQGVRSPGRVTVTDLDGDGIPDLIVANSGSNDILVYLGLGGNRYNATPRAFDTGTNPAGVTVADLTANQSPGGVKLPDLVVANQGSNDVSILLGEETATGWTMVPGPRLKAGEGPTSTLVADVYHNGTLDLLISNSESNDVLLLKGRGKGYFDDNNPIRYQTGIDPGPIELGTITNQPGQMDLVTVNAGSNNLTLIRDINGGNTTGQEFGSGGQEPIAVVMGDFYANGSTELLVANNADGHLALFLGGAEGLSLLGSTTEAGLPHPTDLEMDPVTNEIFGASQGISPAAVLVNLEVLPDVETGGGGGGGGGSGGGGGFFGGGLGGVGKTEFAVVPAGGSAALPRGPSDEQVALLQTGGESALALAAVILSVSIETVSEASTPPNQPKEVQDQIALANQETTVTAVPVAIPADIASSLANYLSGLEESFADVRAPSRGERMIGAVRSARGIEALDSLVMRWSPIARMAGPTFFVASKLARWGSAAAGSSRLSTPLALPRGPRIQSPPPSASIESSRVAPICVAYASIAYGGVALALVEPSRSAGELPGRKGGRRAEFSDQDAVETSD